MSTRLVCARCAKSMTDYREVGYDGPAGQGRPDPDNQACSPLMDWIVLCASCAQQFSTGSGTSKRPVALYADGHRSKTR